jgi:UbiD family decarboxylase
VKQDLRAFLDQLMQDNDLIEVDIPISPRLEMTEIGHRLIEEDGPAVLYKHPVGSQIPAVANLFASSRRIRKALGVKTDHGLTPHPGHLCQG